MCGRLKSDYSYSNTVVYNTFVWAKATGAQRTEIERAAQGILDARALYPDWTLAQLYNEETMPEELRAAHERNDRLVEALYGFTGLTEDQMVARLIRLYRDKKISVDAGGKV